MEFKLRRYAFAAIVAAICSSTAAAELYTGYWRAHTPSGTSFKCRSVGSDESLRDVLNQAGWPQSKGIPNIDWTNDRAIVVAPDSVYDNAYIQFYGISPKDGGGYRLKYGWEHAADQQTTCQAQFCSTSQGLHEEVTAETIVISFSRSLGDVGSFSCSNLGVDP